MLDLIGELHFSDDDVFEVKTLVDEHLVQELTHGRRVGGSLDLVYFQMSLASNKDSHSLSDGCLQLLIELVDANFVAEVLYCLMGSLLVIWIAVHAENHGDIDGHEDIVVRWAGSHWKSVHDVLLCNEELNFSKRSAPQEATFVLDMVELSMRGNNSKSALWSE